ncbi:hypothetical protein BH09MYX1_BH09MYX1_13190 [soil metagenome]
MMVPAFIRAIARGAKCGGKATLPMSAYLGAAQMAGFFSSRLPRPVEESPLQSPKVAAMTNESERSLLTGLSHFGFGAAAGAVFGALRGVGAIPRGMLGGAAFGTALWAVRYAGLLPELSLHAQRKEAPSHPIVMLSAHWVYGVALARGFDHAA